MSKHWGTRSTRKLTPLVVQTYGAICHICNEQIDTQRVWPDPLSLSIDHLVPRSAGGGNGLENLRPAHLTCNTGRQNKPLRRLASDERCFFRV